MFRIESYIFVNEMGHQMDFPTKNSISEEVTVNIRVFGMNPAHSRRFFVFSLSLFVTLSILVGFTNQAVAQTSSQLTGTVTDPSGAVLTAAGVVVRNLDTGMIRNTTSGDSGRFQVLSLPVGNYEVVVSKHGFAQTTRTGVRLDVGEDADVVIRLALSGEKQQVLCMPTPRL